MQDDRQVDNTQKNPPALPPDNSSLVPQGAFDLEAEQRADILDSQARFLQAYSEFGGNIGKACKFADTTRAMVYRWLDGDPAFKERYEDLHGADIDDVEDALKKRALDTSVPGAQVKALEVYLKAHRPDLYNPRRDALRSAVQVNLILGPAPVAGQHVTIETKAEDVTDQNS